MTHGMFASPGSARPGFSWNTHCLLTRYALRSCSEAGLDEAVPVTMLEDFLSAAADRLPDLIAWYWGILSRKTGITVPAKDPATIRSTKADFLEALRLNPATEIPYYRALAPDEIPSDPAHDCSREGPPRTSYACTSDKETVSGREILAVFSDEPDWGMDQDLFPIAAYGYGEPPFGPATGKSSQAPFHMAFFHEYPLVKLLFPSVRKTFLDVRVRGFFALAGLAAESGIPYWALRFRSWAMHYVQDLTQPYHAMSLPFPIWRLLKSLAKTPRPTTFAEQNKNLLMNRHRLFEAVVHLLLNDAAKNHASHPFFDALDGDGQPPRGQASLVVERASEVAADQAAAINSSLELLLNDPRLDDAGYVVEDDASYPLEETVARAKRDQPERFERFVKDVSACLAEAGKMTRYAATMQVKPS
jgi:hypothetical protein